MAENPLNVVLIVVDQWRADCLGFARHPVVQTPHLDMFFQGGVSFRCAYAAVPSCVAARTSLLTGLRPRTHGRVGYHDHVPWDYTVTLPGLLAAAGYHTQAVGKMHVHPARNLVGFHNVVLHDGFLHADRRGAKDLRLVDDYLLDLRRVHGPEADYADVGIGCNGYAVTPWPYDTMLHPSAWVTTQAVNFLSRRDPTKPFFLKVSYHRPHPPLDPPAAYLEIYRDVELPPLPQGDWHPPGPDDVGGLDSPKQLDSAQIDRARRAYYAQITFIDHQLNRLTHALDAHDALDNTVLVFLSDHGDMLYDHGLTAKRFGYEGSARVPLVIRFPESMGISSRLTVDAPVELRDILPTLCELAGVDVPSSIEGRSLLPLCRGESPPWRRYVHGEHTHAHRSNHWLTDGREKYIWYSQTGDEQLFDLTIDPQELHNLAAGDTEKLTQWRSRLVEELRGREEGYVNNGELVIGRPAKPILQEANLGNPG